jgi:hypothetical protein
MGLADAGATPGDRHPDLNCLYPPDVFLHADKGGRVIDVTQPPFAARGDGKTDDTVALVRAYDWVLAQMDKFDWTGAGPRSPLCEYVIYLPNGTYLVSDTVVYSGPWRSYPESEKKKEGRVFERLVRLRFIGQSRDKTIIRLKDHCPGFAEGAKPVISFGKADLNNAVAFNTFRNITVDTGKGNPAAVGLDFCGANNSGIHNVAIVSGDGRGVAGIDIRICPTMGFHDDITVRGFDHGIRMTPYHMTHNSFEYVTLEGQHKAAVTLDQCSTSIRKLRSVNRVPALAVNSAAGQAVLIDSRLEGGQSPSPAIDARQGQVFVRNVQTPGYAAAVYVRGKPAVEDLQVKEYVSGPVLSLREGQAPKSLNLPIEDSPVVPWETDLTRWANVDAFGASGDGETDDAAAVQAAMRSGCSTVYFPKAQYKLKMPVKVPASVERIVGFYGALSGQVIVDEDSPRALIVEDFGESSGALWTSRSPRTLVLSHVRGNYANQCPTPGVKVFINNGLGFGKNERVFRDARFWIRFMNTEHKSSPNFTCNHADMWVFGYKVEGRMTNFEVINGGRLEVLGGVCNEHGRDFSRDIPALRNVDSSLCFVGNTNGPNRFETIVEETLHGKTERLMWTDCPPRPGAEGYETWKDVCLPLYVSYPKQEGTH